MVSKHLWSHTPSTKTFDGISLWQVHLCTDYTHILLSICILKLSEASFPIESNSKYMFSSPCIPMAHFTPLECFWRPVGKLSLGMTFFLVVSWLRCSDWRPWVWPVDSNNHCVICRAFHSPPQAPTRCCNLAREEVVFVTEPLQCLDGLYLIENSPVPLPEVWPLHSSLSFPQSPSPLLKGK